MSRPVDPNQVLVVIQARLGSVRFPEKVLAQVGGMPLIEFMIQRVQRARTVGAVVLAVPARDLNSPLVEVADRQGIGIVGGDENDVLARFAQVISAREEQVVVRLTADCPLIDPTVVDRAVEAFFSSGVDYLRTDLTFPDGYDVEVASRAAILRADECASQASDREHVMPWIAGNSEFRRAEISHERDVGHLRLTVDEPLDLAVVSAVVDTLADPSAGLSTVIELYDERPDLFAANAGLVRNEGSRMSDSLKLWGRAKRIMPGGVSLLSKRPDMHLPGLWPTYFTEAHGCQVTSLDGRRYLDMGLMGVGTSILGYGHPRVDEAVMRVVAQGVVSTLNSPEEVLLAEELVALHPWSAQARFARSGGEACAMAVRIGRAASGRDGVAVCGYHGWHDWYLAANLSEDTALDGHLLPGLSTKGVPRSLLGTAHAFAYNDLEGLLELVDSYDIGVIFMEVERSVPPDPGFLEGVRGLATERGIVLVFDECTSGFRQVMGGKHLTTGVSPDMAVFGKTLGNGYAISAVLGTEEVMSVARELFISSTFWSERLGPAAALATLNEMALADAPAQVDDIGQRFRSGLFSRLESAPEVLKLSGLPALTVIGLEPILDPALLKTFVNSRLLGLGYLGGPAFYAALPHAGLLDRYVEELSSVLDEAISLGNEGIADAMRGQPTATVGFARLA